MEDIKTLPEKFAALEAKVGLKLLRRAGRKAGMLLRDRASSLAPRGATGKLRDTMMAATRKETQTSIQVIVGPSRDAFYGRFVDKGTKPHDIVAAEGGRSYKWQARRVAAGKSVSRVLANKSTGEFFGRVVKHPGIRATGFLDRAIESGGDEAATVFAVEIDKQVTAAFDKLAAAAAEE